VGILVAQLTVLNGATVFPLLDTKYSCAAPRHAGETRHGSLGSVNKYPEQSLVALAWGWENIHGSERGFLRFRWEFRSTDLEEFAGFFLSMGRIGVDTVNPDGTPGPALDLLDDSPLNLDDISGLSGPPFSIEALRFVLRGDGGDQDLKVRVELEDGGGHKAAVRVPLSLRGTELSTFAVALSSFPSSVDKTALKLVSVVIERLHVTAGIRNPDAGGFDVLEMAWVDEDSVSLPSAAGLLALSDREFVTTLARADFETLWRLSDTATGACLDRTLFRDLIHWGATGWLLASLHPAVEKGWISSAQAEERALRVLRFLDEDARWGDAPAGYVGNSRGVIYRFGGIDPAGLDGPLTGTRKIDLGRVNAVEASVIDTALLHLGILTCAAAFDAETTAQRELRQRADSVLNRTCWEELIEPESGQFFLAWKPEIQTDGPYFAAPSAFGGFWASHDEAGARPLTIDYATAEGYMAALLAVGSATHPVSATVWYKIIREVAPSAGEPVVLTWPGAWFTYAFLTSTYLDPGLGRDRGSEWGTVSVDWRANTTATFRAFAALSPSNELILPDACELPDATYIAQGMPALAVDKTPRFTGALSPYSYQMAIGLGDDVALRAIAALRSFVARLPELYDPLSGLLDTLHPDLAVFPSDAPMLRRTGPWVQNQKWPLNAGAALVAQFNYLDGGVIWKTAAQHSVMERAIKAIYQSSPPCERQVGLLRPWGHDAWSAAAGARLLVIPDHYAEVCHVYTPDGLPGEQISYTQIGDVLALHGIAVERSGGPAGLRDAAVLPDGDVAVLIAGPGQDAILKVAADSSLSLLATGFDSSARGDDTGHTRLAAGGNPSRLVVSSLYPVGVAVFDLEGVFQHNLDLPQRPCGLAFAPRDTRLFVLYPDGAVVVHPDVHDPSGVPFPLAQLPVNGRDLAFAADWRVNQPALVAVGADGNLYRVALDDGGVTMIEGEGLTHVVGLDLRGQVAVLAQDESALLDIAGCSQVVRLLAPEWQDGVFRCWIDAADTAVLVAEASTDLITWFPSGEVVPGTPWARLEHAANGAPRLFYRVRVQ